MQSPSQHLHADRRRASRHPVDRSALLERSDGSEFTAHITNISANGFMLSDVGEMQKGDRVTVRLPVIGRIEAYNKWSHNGRCGFEFERIVRLTDFMAMLDRMQ